MQSHIDEQAIELKTARAIEENFAALAAKLGCIDEEGQQLWRQLSRAVLRAGLNVGGALEHHSDRGAGEQILRALPKRCDRPAEFAGHARRRVRKLVGEALGFGNIYVRRLVVMAVVMTVVVIVITVGPVDMLGRCQRTSVQRDTKVTNRLVVIVLAIWVVAGHQGKTRSPCRESLPVIVVGACMSCASRMVRVAACVAAYLDGRYRSSYCERTRKTRNVRCRR